MNSQVHLFDRDNRGVMFVDTHPDFSDALVDLERDQDLQVWTGRLSCSAEKLLAALESVRPRVEHVSEYLRAGW